MGTIRTSCGHRFYLFGCVSNVLRACKAYGCYTASRGVSSDDFMGPAQHAGQPIRIPFDKHNAPLLLYAYKMSISTDLTIFVYRRAFPVGSRHISVRFYVCETTRRASAALL